MAGDYIDIDKLFDEAADEWDSIKWSPDDHEDDDFDLTEYLETGVTEKEHTPVHDDWKYTAEERSISPNILSIYADERPASDVILDSVAKYTDRFTAEELRFLKEYLLINLFLLRNSGEQTSMEFFNIRVARNYLDKVVSYTYCFTDLLEAINYCSDRRSCEPFIDSIYDGLSPNEIQRIVSTYIGMELDEVKSIKHSDFFLYDERSRELILHAYSRDGFDFLEDAIRRGYKSRITAGFPDTEPKPSKIEEFLIRYSSPGRITEYLDTRIVGQREAKRAAAMLLYKHIRRTSSEDRHRPKEVTLFYGDTGCGKTHIWRCLADISPVPVMIRAANDITANGFKGADFGTMLKECLKEDPCPIIVLDEIDKICRPSFTSMGENVSIEVQSVFLKALEGDTVTDETSKAVDPSGVTFVCSGVFTGLEQEIKRPVVGFNAGLDAEVTDRNDSGKSSGNGDIPVGVDKFIEYGMLPELAGRITTFVKLSSLSKEDFLRVLDLRDNPVNELRRQLDADFGIKLAISRAAKYRAAELADETGLGVRGMINLISSAANRKCFDALDNGKSRIVINAKDIG